MARILLLPALCIFMALSCKPASTAPPSLSSAESEVRSMFDNYHKDIARSGLTGEFKYLDSTANFFWVPPGYTTALSYDSVRHILEANATLFRSVQLHWDSLQVFPLSAGIVNYTGIVRGTMIDTANNKVDVALIETGIVIKREDGWKLLSGQTANLPLPAGDGSK